MSIDKLPLELKDEILQYLDPQDLKYVSHVSSFWRNRVLNFFTSPAFSHQIDKFAKPSVISLNPGMGKHLLKNKDIVNKLKESNFFSKIADDSQFTHFILQKSNGIKESISDESWCDILNDPNNIELLFKNPEFIEKIFRLDPSPHLLGSIIQDNFELIKPLFVKYFKSLDENHVHMLATAHEELKDFIEPIMKTNNSNSI